MAKIFQQIRVGNVADDAVAAKTGKTWAEWFKILDKAGARMMEHREISQVLQEQWGVSRWWGNVVAVGYENERGIRADGSGPPEKRYEVTLSKLLPAPRTTAWTAWEDAALRVQWLPDAQFAIAKALPPKSMELDWPGETRVTVRFQERRGRTTVVVTHAKLAEDETDRVQRYWSAALDRLRVLMASLTGGF